MSQASETHQTTEQKILAEVTQHLKSASSAKEAESQAQARAEASKSEEAKQHALEEAANYGKIAEDELKVVKRLQSGAWQGAGIGASAGLGIGTAVGTLVGAITAIPTTGVGLLVGAGAGALHGPWYKIGGKAEKEMHLDNESDKRQEN